MKRAYAYQSYMYEGEDPYIFISHSHRDTADLIDKMFEKIIKTVKNKMTDMRQWWIEFHIDPKWLEAFHEANKDVFRSGNHDSEVEQEEDDDFESWINDEPLDFDEGRGED